MKIVLCLTLGLALVHADPGVIGPQDARKTRNPANGPTSYNTISPPDSETLSKLQNQVAPTVQIPIKPPTTVKVPETASPFNTVPPPSAVPSPYLRQPHQAIAPVSQGQYYVAMVPQAAGNHMLAPATTPLIMQYINPQGQPTGGLQYIQLLRPVVYPYGNQQYQQYQQYPGYLQQPQTIGNPSAGVHPTSYNVSPTPPPTTTTTQPGFVPFQPASTVQQAVTQYAPVSHIHSQPPTYSNGPVGQYSSPVLSYYPHRFLVNPSELNFNTNEYIPSSGDGVYLKGVKSMRA
ncbi:AGAP013354-PA-like protein [Anopheles sinensis]|uniref:AGAP013354-PA-like protein n=1 Tax=Anopheles sinensis TaxID=74873 RepID=A0A084VE43_ANOSI|nr:AGAP013354-PA-like protein [Anopheles sinensis]